MPALNRNAIFERECRALAMRVEGFSFETVAAALGVTTGTARATVRRAERRATGTYVPGTPEPDPEFLVPAFAVGQFGVEIETVGLTCEQAAAALRSAGIDAQEQDYNHHTAEYWKVVPDASLSYVSAEVVSPILHGEEGLAEVRAVMGALRDAGATVNGTCGMHVHVSVEDLTGPQIADLVRFYAEHQRDVNRFLPPARRRSRWARALSTEMLTRVCHSLNTLRQANVSNRYHSVNLAAFPRYGTVEFRQHGGTLNGEKATAWVELLFAMRAAVLAGNGTRVRGNRHFLDDLRLAGGLPESSAAYLARRAEAFSRTRRQAAA